MPSPFPASNDSFSPPATPETTPLSSAGTSNRNHTQSHEDLGDAIENIEANVPLLSHDHSGGGARPTNKLAQANTHQTPDTDTSPTSLHHTLGAGANQAASGTHTHDTRYPQLGTANSFTLLQTFTGGVSVPQSQWANAQHTHAAPNQGGMVLPWKHFESRVVNATLTTSQAKTWDFIVPALPLVCDLEIHCHISLESNTATYQEVTFTLLDITLGSVNIMLGRTTTRHPSSAYDRYKWDVEVYGQRSSVSVNQPRAIRVGVANGTTSPNTIVGAILFVATPYNDF